MELTDTGSDTAVMRGYFGEDVHTCFRTKSSKAFLGPGRVLRRTDSEGERAMNVSGELGISHDFRPFDYFSRR